MTEPSNATTIANVAITYVKETSRAREEAGVWRDLFLQALKMLAGRDAELRDAVDHLVEEQRELLLQGVHEFGSADRELLMLTLSMLDYKQRPRHTKKTES